MGEVIRLLWRWHQIVIVLDVGRFQRRLLLRQPSVIANYFDATSVVSALVRDRVICVLRLVFVKSQCDDDEFVQVGLWDDRCLVRVWCSVYALSFRWLWFFIFIWPGVITENQFQKMNWQTEREVWSSVCRFMCSVVYDTCPVVCAVSRL